MITDTNNIVAPNTYPLVNYLSYVGNGDSFVLSSPQIQGYVTNNSGASQIQLVVNGFVPPVNSTPTNIAISLSRGAVTLSWPADHTGWSLQGQTNSGGIGTNWVTIPNTALTNVYTSALYTNSGGVFYRLVYTNSP